MTFLTTKTLRHSRSTRRILRDLRVGRAATFAVFVVCIGFISVRAQNTSDVVKRGEMVFAQSCTGYCHAASGGTGGSAPRLAARGFDQGYINDVVSRGIPGTPMQGFATTLSRADLAAVIAYVASLNGVANPAVAPRTATSSASPAATERSTAASARSLFFDATRGFGRCSTCHEVGGQGIPVASRIAKTPDDVMALRNVATPRVSTVTMNGSTMPALLVTRGRNVVFYDLTTAPPVLVTADPTKVTITGGSTWRHASVIGTYTDDELDSILRFLRETK